MKVIMPVFNVNEQFVNLTDLAIQSLGKCELILVDNGSTVGAGLLRDWADIYIRNKNNLGYAKAVNQGLKLCEKGELVAVANNDIKVSEGWEAIAEEIMQDKSIGSLHFTMLPYDEPFRLGDKVWITGKERWCTGSFFVMRNNWLFDENFLNSYDDWDLGFQIRTGGYKQAYTNRLQYQHMDSFTQQIMPDRAERDKKNAEYFKQKWGNYAEVLFEKEFPGELSKPWKPFP